jgi:REP element-mobilizing transposase RayT
MSYLAGMKPGRRRSIRLPCYDYASAGWYFVTICCKDRAHLFGEIRNGEMVLNEVGDLVEKWWNKIPDKFPDIELGEYQIMPNHFHAIVINVGADPRACLAGRRVGPGLPVAPDTPTDQQEIS